MSHGLTFDKPYNPCHTTVPLKVFDCKLRSLATQGNVSRALGYAW